MMDSTQYYIPESEANILVLTLDLYDYNLINISKISGISKLLDWLKDWQLGD